MYFDSFGELENTFFPPTAVTHQMLLSLLAHLNSLHSSPLLIKFSVPLGRGWAGGALTPPQVLQEGRLSPARCKTPPAFCFSRGFVGREPLDGEFWMNETEPIVSTGLVFLFKKCSL